MAQKIRYGAGGVPYYEQTSDIEKEQKELEASLKQSKAAKAERVTKKKKKVIQEIMGDGSPKSSTHRTQE